MILTWVFLVSLWGIAVLFTVRSYEIRRDVVFFKDVRSMLDSAVIRTVLALKRFTEHTLRDAVKKMLTYGSHTVAYTSLLVVRALERRLTNVVMFIRGKYTPKRGKTETSEFLEEVGRRGRK
jgi:hypothetical protein